MPAAAAPLIDREFLEKLERLTLRWHKSFPGLVGGHNASRFPGPGQEVLDHRHFHHGDDLRAVNWRAYLRLDKLFLKMFQVEPRVPVRMLLDVSRSMETGAIPKFHYARQLAAALSYVGLVRLDTICIHPFSEALWEAHICSGGRHRFQPTASFLEGLEARGGTNYLQVARQFISIYPQRGLLIMISDFLDDGDCERPLRFLSDFGHELMLVHLWAEEDRDPPWDGELELTDVETGRRLELAFDQEARQAYTTAFDEFARSLRDLAMRKGGRYVGLSTQTPLDEAIFGPIMGTRGMS
jgi:uncharacterized protein (DUF58 family)